MVRIKVRAILGNIAVIQMINNHIDRKMKADDIGEFKYNSRKYSTVIEFRKNIRI
jgi:hypothetical protein